MIDQVLPECSSFCVSGARACFNRVNLRVSSDSQHGREDYTSLVSRIVFVCVFSKHICKLDHRKQYVNKICLMNNVYLLYISVGGCLQLFRASVCLSVCQKKDM